ncbi:hypothetical protein ACIP9H_17795 [Streptomyces sp. NPDC088732]|uniref:hypothetical protein n=1 Tax=Streptomyces sp. NPDC088732 TaxID=3365879 RepID=UPI003821A798
MIAGMVFFLALGTCVIVAQCVKRRWRQAAASMLGLLVATLAFAANVTGQLWLGVAATIAALGGLGWELLRRHRDRTDGASTTK